ncbi:unnamed protein product [Boreogadus saida]
MEMDDSTFQRHLRLTKPQFHFFLDKLEILRPQNVDMKKVIMFLWYLSNQNSFRELSDKFDKFAAHNAIVEMLDTTCELASTFIIWPSECEKRGNAVVFHRKCGIHNILGKEGSCQHHRSHAPGCSRGRAMHHREGKAVIGQLLQEQGCPSFFFHYAVGRSHQS